MLIQCWFFQRRIRSLRVLFDRGEVTVSIGGSFHEHFQSGKVAAEFLCDVLAEKVWIHLFFDKRGELWSNTWWRVSDSDEPEMAEAYEAAKWIDHTWRRRVRERPPV